ncbi:MAG TPA: FHA domain-containing protein [Thermoanaerobaculia bacterium]|jgi:DNA-binding winged helix-turn-helix (wHTH) protein|nr:FHA domain-containing protein [Thermoanaerobaculia bacterium]
MAYRFGPFLYDQADRCLLRDGVEVPLTHKSRELLLLFLENPRRMLPRETIVESVWRETAVTDDAVGAQIAKLRRALGDAGGEILKMVRREGYRWDAEVRVEDTAPRHPVRSVVPSSGPRFRLILRDREIQLLDGPNVIGRDRDSAVWIDHESVSRRHAQVVVARGRARLEDLESRNGTFLNGRRISRGEPLSDGDTMRIGVIPIVFRTLVRLKTTRTVSER